MRFSPALCGRTSLPHTVCSAHWQERTDHCCWVAVLVIVKLFNNNSYNINHPDLRLISASAPSFTRGRSEYRRPD